MIETCGNETGQVGKSTEGGEQYEAAGEKKDSEGRNGRRKTTFIK